MVKGVQLSKIPLQWGPALRPIERNRENTRLVYTSLSRHCQIPVPKHCPMKCCKSTRSLGNSPIHIWLCSSRCCDQRPKVLTHSISSTPTHTGAVSSSVTSLPVTIILVLLMLTDRGLGQVANSHVLLNSSLSSSSSSCQDSSSIRKLSLIYRYLLCIA